MAQPHGHLRRGQPPGQRETFGVAVVEAMACGVPVVVSDAGGLPEVVVHGVSGLVVPREQPQALAASLAGLVLDTALRQRLAAAGLTRATNAFAWPLCVDRMLVFQDGVVERLECRRWAVMNILLVNHYAGSPRWAWSSGRTTWRANGCAPGTGCDRRRRLLACAQRASRGRALDELIDGIAFRWLPPRRLRGNGFGRGRNIWAFLRAAVARAPRLAAEFRARRGHRLEHLPDGHLGRAAHRAPARARKLVYEVHDLWPLSPIELGGMSRWHPFIRLCQTAEDAACRDADVVVSMLPKVHDHMATRTAWTCASCTSCPTASRWTSGRPRRSRCARTCAAHLDAQRAAGRTVVGYAGSHGLPNALDVLLDAAALLRDEPIAFVLVGDGLEKAAARATCAPTKVWST